MRRHHFLSLKDTNHPPDSVSLLIGAQADQRRRHSSQLPTSPGVDMNRRLHSVFGGTVPGELDNTSPDSPKSDCTTDENEGDDGPGFLGRVHSYSRLMHAHTKSQLARPRVATLPSYQKTMHAFTLNQLNDHRRASVSENSSPRIAPPKMQVELSKLTLDEVPPAPGNTPEVGSRRGESAVQGIDFRKLKRRSLTDPEAVRGVVAGIRARDFAAG